MKKNYVGWIGRSVAILVAVFLIACPVSCKMSENGLAIEEADFSCPELKKLEVLDSKNMSLVFSRQVELKNLVLVSNKPSEIGIDAIKYFNNDDKTCKIDILFAEKTRIGDRHIIKGKSFDATGNSLEFSLPFLGYNDTVPSLEITEISTKCDPVSKGNARRCEYVRIKAKTSGNLSGVIFWAASYDKKKIYEFPALEIKEGETILLHLRAGQDGAISEMADDLNASTALLSEDGIRDLWNGNDEKFLQSGTGCEDIAILQNSLTGDFIDVVPYAQKTEAEGNADVKWSDKKNEKFTEILEKAIENGLWGPSAKLSDAVSIYGRPLFKKTGNTHDADAWKK